jgi:hypothetical protein
MVTGSHPNLESALKKVPPSSHYTDLQNNSIEIMAKDIAEHYKKLVAAHPDIPEVLTKWEEVRKGLIGLDYTFKWDNGKIIKGNPLEAPMKYDGKNDGIQWKAAELYFQGDHWGKKVSIYDIPKKKSIEDAVLAVVSLFAIGIGGLFAGTGATGNVVGTDATLSLLGFGLIVLGAAGLVLRAWKSGNV